MKKGDNVSWLRYDSGEIVKIEGNEITCNFKLKSETERTRTFEHKFDSSCLIKREGCWLIDFATKSSEEATN